MEGGKIVADRPAAKEIRDYVLNQLRHFSLCLLNYFVILNSEFFNSSLKKIAA